MIRMVNGLALIVLIVLILSVACGGDGSNGATEDGAIRETSLVECEASLKQAGLCNNGWGCDNSGECWSKCCFLDIDFRYKCHADAWYITCVG